MTEWLADNLLTILTLVGSMIAGLIVAWYAQLSRTGKLEGRVGNAEKEITRSLSHHAGHFTEIGDIKTDIAGIKEKLSSHVEEDHTSFERIEALLKESRDDTKAIRAHLMNSGK